MHVFSGDDTDGPQAGMFEHVAKMSRTDGPRPLAKGRSTVHPIKLPPIALLQTQNVNESLEDSLKEEQEVS